MTTQASGQVVYKLKHPFKNGTTHFVFEPLEFLAKLAALVPRPRANLTRYHGVLAPNAKYQSLVVPAPDRQAKKKHKCTAHLSRHHQPRQTAPSLHFPGQNDSSGSSR